MAWAPRSSGQGMRWDINLSEVAELIGTIYGANNANKTNVYIDHLMRAAHAAGSCTSQVRRRNRRHHVLPPASSAREVDVPVPRHRLRARLRRLRGRGR